MTAWFVQTLIASMLLMLAIAAVRPLLRERVEPKAMYALWSLPALRMVMPPLPLLEADAPSVPVPVAAPSAVSADFPLTTILLGVWLAGAMLWFVWHIARYRHFVRSSRADAIGRAVTVEVSVSAAVAWWMGRLQRAYGGARYSCRWTSPPASTRRNVGSRSCTN